MKKTIENLDDAVKELELVLDEDEPISYRCGSGFIQASFEEAQGKLQQDLDERRAELTGLLAKQGVLAGEMEALRRVLYDRFGDAIRLEL